MRTTIKKGIAIAMVFCITLAGPAGALAAIGHRACPGGTSNCVASNTNTSSLAFPSMTMTAGDFISDGIRTGVTGITVNTPTDTLGNSYHCKPTVPQSTVTQVTWCYAWNTGSGANVITNTTNSNTNIHQAIDFYNGVATTCDPTDGTQVSGTATGTIATVSTGSNITTTVASDALIAVGSTSVNDVFTAGTSYILRANVNPGRVANEDQIGVAAGSYSAAINFTSGSQGAVIVLNAIAPTCPGVAPAGHAIFFSVANNSPWILVARFFHLGFLVGDRLP